MAQKFRCHESAALWCKTDSLKDKLGYRIQFILLINDYIILHRSDSCDGRLDLIECIYE